MKKKTLKYALLVSAAVGFAGFGAAAGVAATTNSELLSLVEKVAEYGLKGYIEYLKFLLDLFKEVIKGLV